MGTVYLMLGREFDELYAPDELTYSHNELTVEAAKYLVGMLIVCNYSTMRIVIVDPGKFDMRAVAFRDYIEENYKVRLEILRGHDSIPGPDFQCSDICVSLAAGSESNGEEPFSEVVVTTGLCESCFVNEMISSLEKIWVVSYGMGSYGKSSAIPADSGIQFHDFGKRGGDTAVSSVISGKIHLN